MWGKLSVALNDACDLPRMYAAVTAADDRVRMPPAPRQDPRPLPAGVIVTGMHRSATSLTASVLIGCGWQPPGHMIGPLRGNKRGHFEDDKIHGLHKRMLKARGIEWDSATELRARRRRPFGVGGYEEDIAGVVARLRGGQPWVWKNPRAAIWIEAWGERLPEAHVVICVRPPAGVVDSLLRRGDWLRVAHTARFKKSRRAVRALSLWYTYNHALYRFARRHPERATVVLIPDDLDLLASATSPSLFDPKLIATKPSRKLRLCTALGWRAQLLHWKLSRLHDPAKLAALLAGPSPATQD